MTDLAGDNYPLVVSIPLRGRCNVNSFVTIAGLSKKQQFPSPCGEDVMSTSPSLTPQSGSSEKRVSIPLRGRCNVNKNGSRRGEIEFAFGEFPSPCGEDVMSTAGLQLLPKVSKCFHPLAGKM